MIREVRRCLHHTPGVARGADSPAFAGEGHKVVIPAVITAGAGKAVGKDAAFQIFAKGLAHKGLWRVVVTLPVELAGTGQRMPGLKMFGNGLVQQRALGVARGVEFGFGARLPTRERVQVRWAGGSGHGAVPAAAGCLMILFLYPAISAWRKLWWTTDTPDLIASCAYPTGAAGVGLIDLKPAGWGPAKRGGAATAPRTCPYEVWASPGKVCPH